MRLFEVKPRMAMDAAYHAETTFAYLDRSGRRIMAAQRELLESWFARYPREHRAHLRGRLFSSRESEQQSAWWELYLHESFVRAGYLVHASSGTPDFTIDGLGGRFHVEATARFESPSAQNRERREQALHDALDRTDTGAWRIGLSLLRAGANSAPAGRFRARIRRWLATLDFDEVRRTGPQAGRNGVPRFPYRVFEESDWAIGVEAWPAGLLRDEDRRRAVISWGSGEAVRVQNEEPLRDAIARKASECRDLDAPLIIAVLVARQYGHEHQVESALFGLEAFEYDPSLVPRVGMREVRTPGGLWSPANGQVDVAGVLAGARLDPFSFVKIAPTMWTNPMVRRSSLPVDPALPWHHRWVDDSGRLQGGAIPAPCGFFGLDPYWPGQEG
jgi:hypothetical protein